MTMAMQAVNIKPIGPKVLRIGVIQGGKIIEERIVRKRETVTVGSSPLLVEQSGGSSDEPEAAASSTPEPAESGTPAPDATASTKPEDDK